MYRSIFDDRRPRTLRCQDGMTHIGELEVANFWLPQGDRLHASHTSVRCAAIKQRLRSLCNRDINQSRALTRALWLMRQMRLTRTCMSADGHCSAAQAPPSTAAHSESRCTDNEITSVRVLPFGFNLCFLITVIIIFRETLNSSTFKIQFFYQKKSIPTLPASPPPSEWPVLTTLRGTWASAYDMTSSERDRGI